VVGDTAHERQQVVHGLGSVQESLEDPDQRLLRNVLGHVGATKAVQGGFIDVLSKPFQIREDLLGPGW
jgi:hypothetical protein